MLLARTGHASLLADEATRIAMRDEATEFERGVHAFGEPLMRVVLGAVVAVITVNALKSIQITTSANFGNMVSVALATPLLPFLPLTATRILLNKLSSDLPSMAIASDRVDAQQLRRAQRWHLKELRHFLLAFGLISSMCDDLVFAVLLVVFHAGPPLLWTTTAVVAALAVALPIVGASC